MTVTDKIQNLNILIVAPNASSRFGGEAFLPLKYFQILIKRRLSVDLITHARNRDDLEQYLGSHIDKVTFIEDTVWHKLVWRAGQLFPKVIEETIFANILNLLNELYQTRQIRRLLAQKRIDVIHQPTPVSPLAPSFVYGFGVPVVIGPLNGNMSYPPGFENLESAKARFIIKIFRKIAPIINRVIPGKYKAAVLLVANSRTQQGLPFHSHPCVIELIENGVDLKTWQTKDLDPAPVSSALSLRLVFMGRLIALKAVDVTLAAISQARRQGFDITLDLLGDGPEKQNLKDLSKHLGLEDAVSFHGFVPQTECAGFLARADALILNSVRECGGAVVLEAMCAGLPVIASDWGGPADYLDDTCGILIPPVPKTSFADRTAEAIVFLAQNSELRRDMGHAGYRKVYELYDWDTKVSRIIEIYRSVL